MPPSIKKPPKIKSSHLERAIGEGPKEFKSLSKSPQAMDRYIKKDAQGPFQKMVDLRSENPFPSEQPQIKALIKMEKKTLPIPLHQRVRHLSIWKTLLAGGRALVGLVKGLNQRRSKKPPLSENFRTLHFNPGAGSIRLGAKSSYEKNNYIGFKQPGLFPKHAEVIKDKEGYLQLHPLQNWMPTYVRVDGQWKKLRSGQVFPLVDGQVFRLGEYLGLVLRATEEPKGWRLEVHSSEPPQYPPQLPPTRLLSLAKKKTSPSLSAFNSLPLYGALLMPGSVDAGPRVADLFLSGGIFGLGFLGIAGFFSWFNGKNKVVLTQNQGEKVFSDPSLKDPQEMDPSFGIGADLYSFNQSLLDHQQDIPHLTKGMEESFEAGGMVYPFNGNFMMMDFPSGAYTLNGVPVEKEAFQAYQAWKAKRAFPQVDLSTSRPAWSELQRRANSLGLNIPLVGGFGEKGTLNPDDGTLEIMGGQIVFLNELMKILPDSLFRAGDLKNVYLNTPRHGPGLFSSYDQGSVYLYNGAFNGSRRNMAGLFLHEIGHSLNGKYDRDPRMIAAHQTINKNRAHLGLDWNVGPEGRALYQGTYHEFIAELFLMYVVAGPTLRSHINNFPKNSLEREAWNYVYGDLKNNVFGGREYGF